MNSTIKPDTRAMRIALIPFLVSLAILVILASVLMISAQASETNGYTLFSALDSQAVSLIDEEGTLVHTWETDYRPGLAIYLLENGLLLHTGNTNNTTFTTTQIEQTNVSGGKENASTAAAQKAPQTNSSGAKQGDSTAMNTTRESSAGGAGGIVQLLDWNGNVTWEYTCSSSTQLQHHDVEVLPNGNILLIVWEYKTEQEALDAGWNPQLLADGELWPDSILEIQPTGTNSGEIVWEWHVWDHLVQDYDASKDNYGSASDHPELIDLNYTLGTSADWTHINAVDYNEELDQILLSVHNFNEIWIIDHSTTTQEAAGHTGGNSGCGGDLLFRWGNPQAYDTGNEDGMMLFGQHDAEWIDAGLPGAGNILIFNNGSMRSDGKYSSIEEITPQLNADGSYADWTDSDIIAWHYEAETPTDFFARNISSVQRLTNGNTLINNGPNGIFFEVTPEGETVWEYKADGSYFNVERYTADYAGFAQTALQE